MIEQVIGEFSLPFREPLKMFAFMFGVNDDGHPVSCAEDLNKFERAACLVAGLRGDEVQQTFICSQIVSRLGELEVAGALTPGQLIAVIPCANPASAAIGWRFWPGDKTDINRMFPGYDHGETTQRIAAALFEFVKGYRYGVHFSSFYLQGDFLPHVRVMHGCGQEANHGADFELPYVLHHVPGSFDTTTLHYNWRLWDCEAYTLYTKETSLIDHETAQEAVRATLRFLDARGVIRCPSHRGFAAQQLTEHALVPVSTSCGGIFCPRVQVGDIVCAGCELAIIVDPLRGICKETLLAPCDGAVFFEARTPLVNEGTLAFQIVPPKIDEALESELRGNFLDPEA